MNSLLSIKDLTVAVGDKGLVNQVSFDVPQGKIVAIAGGSGSGKTTIGLSILRLIPSALQIRKGSIIFEGIRHCLKKRGIKRFWIPLLK